MSSPTDTTTKTAVTSAVIAVMAALFSIGYIVFGAGGLPIQIDRHSEEIKSLQQKQDTSATKDDFRRLESKIDALIERELNKQNRAR